MINKSNLYLFFILLLGGFSCTEPSESVKNADPHEKAIRDIHQRYVDAWLANDEDQLMDLLEADAMIQPNSMTPIKGKKNIRTFWFPKDSSTTIINRFETEIISYVYLDTIAVTTHTSLLDWDYSKGTTNFGMVQQGINTTVYRRQPNREWKIWRSMWTDIDAREK